MELRTFSDGPAAPGEWEGISSRAVIHPTVQIGRGVTVESNVVIEEGVVLHNGVWVSSAWTVGAYSTLNRNVYADGLRLRDLLGGMRIPDGSVLEGVSHPHPDHTYEAHPVIALYTTDAEPLIRPGCHPWEPLAATLDRLSRDGGDGTYLRTLYAHLSPEACRTRVDGWREVLSDLQGWRSDGGWGE